MPMLSSRLPAYSGEYEVGVIDIEAPCEKRKVADALFKDTNEPAFELETLLFSLYYPAVSRSHSSKRHHKWVSNLNQQAHGYARLAHVNKYFVPTVFEWALWALVGSTLIPANVDAPFHGTRKVSDKVEVESPLNNDELSKHPVIIFSHGMVSNRTSYTQFCGELASKGYVVAAIEHRDGSGPGTEVYSADGSIRDVFYITQTQLTPEPDEADFKAMQIAMRQAEVEETVKVLKRINQGFGSELFRTNRRGEGADLAGWKGRLDEERFVLAGHSFGATLALHALKGGPSKTLPFNGGIMFDPGKHSGPLNDDIDVPILVINSQSWSSKFSLFQGRAHFDVVKDLVKKVMRKEPGRKPRSAWFLTSKGTTHPSVTDAPLIHPFLLSWTTGSTIDAREGVMEYVVTSAEFMRFLEDGSREGVLAEDVTHPMYDEDTRSSERKLRMDRTISKHWQIHVSPPNSDTLLELHDTNSNEEKDDDSKR